MRLTLPRAWRPTVSAAAAIAALLAPTVARALTADSLASPVRFSIRPAHPCASDTVRLVMTASECPPCVLLDSLGPLPIGGGPIPARATWNPTCIPGECFALQTLSLALGRLAPGDYHVSVNLAVRVVNDSSLVDTVYSSEDVAFTVADSCGPILSPAPLVYVTHVAIGDHAVCDSAIACSNLQCPGLDVPVSITGLFPSPCFSLRSAVLLPTASPTDYPTMMLVMRADSCVAGGCATVQTPWSAHFTLPPEQPGLHQARIIEAFQSCSDTTRLQAFIETFAYTVMDTCISDTTLVRCVTPVLVPPPVPAGGCGVLVGPGGSAPVPLAVRSGVALAGIQGAIHVIEPFRLTALAPIDPSFHVSWTADDRGARYVLFSTGGALMPAGLTPALLATVTADSSAHDGARAMMFGIITVASDSAGQSAPLCPLPEIALIAGFPLCVGQGAGACDVNRDGVDDVRDLVLMARCLGQASADSDSVRFCHDCDGDGRFGIPDLFCCAHDILRFGAPGDSGVVHDDIRVEFGPPVATASGVDVPVRVTGAGSLGAALVRLRYPADRWTVRLGSPALRASAADTPWLPLSDETSPGLVSLAGLRLSPSAPGELSLTLSLDLKPGATAGGSVTVDGVQLADLAGTSVRPASTPDALSLETGTASDVMLSEARPNPFTRQTRFTIRLPRAAFVDLAIHDLAGRRVATLQHGSLDAGEHAFEWTPAGLRDGVYFAKLSADGRTFVARLVLLRDSR